MIADRPPATKVEVSYTKVGSLRLRERVLERWEQMFVDIVEDTRQGSLVRKRCNAVRLEIHLGRLRAQASVGVFTGR
jgi:hypothetical protein